MLKNNFFLEQTNCCSNLLNFTVSETSDNMEEWSVASLSGFKKNEPAKIGTF